jgi:hypothetical protein
MNGRKPSLWGTGLILVLAGTFLVPGISGVVSHARTQGFSQLELGIVIVLALSGAAMIMLGLLERRPSADRPTRWWEVTLLVIACLAVAGGREVFVRTILSGETRTVDLLDDSWSFFNGGIGIYWAISRLRKARAIDRGFGPDSARQDIAAAP